MRQADELYRAGQGRLGTKESVFAKIICTQNNEQLRLIFEDYFKKTRNGKFTH